MELGIDFEILLGYNWLCIHDPDTRRDANGYPIFNRPHCAPHTEQNCDVKKVSHLETSHAN
jgi:hypothetical protein